MPYKRVYKRKTVYRRKAFKRTYAKRRYYGSKRTYAKTHRFMRRSNGLSVQGAVGQLPFRGALQFKLTDLSNWQDFASLYQFYKITNIVASFTLRVSPEAQAANVAFLPKLYFYRDHEDTIIPADLAMMRERMDCKVVQFQPGKAIRVNLKPSILDEVLRSGTTTAYVPKYNQWIPTAANDTNYYGIKYAVDNHTNTNQWVDIEFTYTVMCKTPK